MPRNDAAAPDYVCSGICIHVIDIVQPPGIGILPIDDIDVHQTIVTTALAAKSNAERLQNTAPSSVSDPRELASPEYKSMRTGDRSNSTAFR